MSIAIVSDSQWHYVSVQFLSNGLDDWQQPDANVFLAIVARGKQAPAGEMHRMFPHSTRELCDLFLCANIDRWEGENLIACGPRVDLAE